MSLKSLGAELRRAREERNISLGDISAATRINTKFLEAIEEGNFDVLPPPYVRAFLREYAQSVNLSPESVLAQYDDAHTEKRKDQSTDGTAVVAKPGRQETGGNRGRYITLVAFGIAAAALVLFIINAGKEVPPPPISEVPFDNVVRESEATLVKPETIVGSIAPVKPDEPDSLTLEMTTSDSVWVSIVIDGKKTEEYLLPPGRRKNWIARERFQITMGNAGGASFKLNGEDIPPLGRRGAVVRNVVINEETLNKRL
jgi:cytoskeleton protein RodZ